jgi:chromosome partitioning protein
LPIRYFHRERPVPADRVRIAIADQKEGVGKTTITFNLAQILATKRLKVLAIDNDPQTNLTSSFLENPAELKSNILDAYNSRNLNPIGISKNLCFIGSNISLLMIAEQDFQIVFNLKEALEELRKSFVRKPSKSFDYVIIDSLPSFGHLHLAAVGAADYVLIPVKPAPYSLAGLKDLLVTIKKAKKYFNPRLKILGIVINQVGGQVLYICAV